MQGQEVPARVHARRAAQRKVAPRTHVRRDCAGRLGSEPSAVEGPESTPVGGDRRWARDTAPPPGARQPAPLPAPFWGSGRAEGGPVARPTLAWASGRAPAKNSRIPPASSAAATHRP